MRTFKPIIAILGLILIAGVFSSCSVFNKKKGPGELSEAELDAAREGRFGEGTIPMAEGEGPFRDVNFEFNSSVVDDVARQNIEYNLEILRSNPDIRVQLEGNCDERGTAEYNLALGGERAKAVKDVLASLGLNSTRLSTISYGEEVPLDPTSSEDAWAKNRRVHFSGFKGETAQR